MKRVELLSPAGDKERAYFALEYGADAIYIGAKQYSLRARSSNFEYEDIKEIVKYAHSINKKVYLVTNIICHNYLLSNFDTFFKNISDLKIDGFISADPFIIKKIKDSYEQCDVHISTQQSIVNSKAALFWKKYGNATRVVLGREMKIEEIRATTDALKDKIEIEIFVHGAVCISYSGRCMMSNNYSLRDANVGGCAQSCRWEYKIENKDKCNHFFTMSAKDMAYIDNLEELLKMNIASFKIEGRMKSVNYLINIISKYKKCINNYYNGIDNFRQLEEIKKNVNRDIDNAFLINPNHNKMLYHDEIKTVKQDFAFTIEEKISNNKFLIKSRNYFNLDMKFKIISSSGETKINIIKMYDINNNEINACITPMSKVFIILEEDVIFNKFLIGKIIYE